MAAADPVKPEERSGEDRLEILLRQRYGNASTRSASASWTQTIDTLLAHRSVRSYLPEPVPPATLELAVAAAQSAPTSSNLQAWSVVAVEDAARKARINAVAGNQRQIEQAPLLLVWLADLSRLRRIADGQSSTSEGLDYLESFLLGIIDAALAAQNALVALESLGLGTCYIGAIRNDPITVARELNLPDQVFPVFGLTVGFPDPSIRTDIKPRLPQTTLLHREQYRDNPGQEELIGYNQTLRTFQKIQSMATIDWSEQIARRIATKASLKNRDRLLAILKDFGFQLK
ncbi:NADPH-dependent oxidoreductase (plasmid) [Phyllobacterium sp. A18/5-2]|nr:NADPH-dependent oxidoreductase [Phyllobacterium sp. A18/5-2]UXN67328.1 NADPH-dependent oxidoreductase [Phyllobacterium sp. A18/5-2]